MRGGICLDANAHPYYQRGCGNLLKNILHRRTVWRPRKGLLFSGRWREANSLQRNGVIEGKTLEFVRVTQDPNRTLSVMPPLLFQAAIMGVGQYFFAKNCTRPPAPP